MKNIIFKQYIENDPQVTDFFQFSLQADWKDVSQKVLQDERDPAVIDELISQNSDSKSDAVRRNVDRLKKKDAAIIITGQQLGLFISPLYTIYKVLTTIKLADQVNEKYPELNFIPVFWLEGEDHDYAEINHFSIPDKDGSINQYVLPSDKNERMPTTRRRLPSEISGFIEKLKTDLQPTEFTSELLERLEKIYKPGQSWLSAFKQQMQFIFDDLGLLYFNPTSEKIKQLSLPFIKELIEKNERLLKAIRSKSSELEKKGFHNQVRIQENYSYIFVTDPEKGRQPVFRTSTQFILKNEDQSWSADSLYSFIKDDPNRYSSTVLVRPIWQSWLLPVASYVAGPAEIAYWTQIKSAFNVFDLNMPHLMPRNSLTLLDGRIKRFLDKYSVIPESINADINTFLKETILNQQQFSNLNTSFDMLNQQLDEYQKHVEAELNQIDQTLSSPLNKTISGVKSSIEKFEKRVSRRIEEINDQMNKHLYQIYNTVWPDGKPQERCLSSVYYLNKYGLNWIQKLYEAIDPGSPRHKYLDI